jgi:predicted metalloprotease with PDZ domain
VSGADWIIEGLAEYYSLEILRRSGTISESRFRAAHRQLAEWGQEAGELCKRRSSGSNTALAVSLLVNVDAEIRDKSAGQKSLDDVLRRLAEYSGKITIPDFREIAERIADASLTSLQGNRLRGCGADGQ